MIATTITTTSSSTTTATTTTASVTLVIGCSRLREGTNTGLSNYNILVQMYKQTDWLASSGVRKDGSSEAVVSAANFLVSNELFDCFVGSNVDW